MRATYRQIPALIAELTPFEGNSVTAYNLGDRYVVKSYATVIAEISRKTRKPVYFDIGYYSRTTSKIQNILRRQFGI